MSTLRERIETLAKKYEAHAARIPWGDKCDALMSHAQDLRSALESETREAAPLVCRCGHGQGAHASDGWCEFDDCVCVRFRSLSTPPPANTENDR